MLYWQISHNALFAIDRFVTDMPNIMWIILDLDNLEQITLGVTYHAML